MISTFYWLVLGYLLISSIDAFNINHISIKSYHIQRKTYENHNILSLHMNNVDVVDKITDFDDSKTITVNNVKGKVPVFAIEGDSTEETWNQRIVIYLHFILVFFNIYISYNSFILNYHDDNFINTFSLISSIILSIIFGDFVTGIFHWSVDNYGQLETPIFGSVCAAFQGHHITPYTITFRSFINNVYKIAYGTIPMLVILSISSIDVNLRVFLTLFINWWLLSQEFHKYSHLRQVPEFIKFFQENNIILSKKEHGLHHSAPYEGHYCILTGICNPVLDNSNFFRYLENIVFKLTGNKPNTWKLDETIETESKQLF